MLLTQRGENNLATDYLCVLPARRMPSGAGGLLRPYAPGNSGLCRGQYASMLAPTKKPE